MRLSGTKLSSIHQYQGLGNQLWDLAGSRPSLDLRFADNKSLVDATTGQNLIDLSRASGGTYVDSQGVIRNATTNLLLRSEEFDQSPWAVSNSAVTPNQAVAPNGTTTADLLVKSVAFGSVYQLTNISSLTAHTASFYVKKETNENAAILITDNGAANILVRAYINLDTGVVTNVDGTTTAIPVGNGWYRVHTSFTYTNALNRLYLYPGISSDTSTGGIYLWGAQLEQSSTVGEYIPTTSSINSAPRFDHNPSTGESLGLLVEEARTNYLINSESFAGWTVAANGLTQSTASAIAAPNGQSGAVQLFTEDTTTGTHRIFYAPTTGQTTHTHSIFVKNASGTREVYLSSDGPTGTRQNIVFNLQTGSLVSSTGDWSNAFITPYPNGWYRIGGTITDNGGSVLFIIGLNNNGLSSYTGDGTSGIYIWGAQLEAGAFPTSYIKTEAATATRAADIAQITGTNFSSWYRQDEGTVFAESSTFAPTSTFDAVATIGSSAVSLIASLQRNGTNSRAFGDGVSIDQGGGTFPVNVAVKQSLGFKVNDFSLVTNGSTPAIDSSTNPLPVAEHVYIGCNAATAGILNSHTRRLTYWPQRLPDATLQSITR